MSVQEHGMLVLCVGGWEDGAVGREGVERGKVK